MSNTRVRLQNAIYIAIIACVFLGSATFFINYRDSQEQIIAQLQTQVEQLFLRTNQALAASDLDAQYAEIVRVVAESSSGLLTSIEVVNVAGVIQEQSALYSADGVSPSLILALIERESSFNPRAESPMKASGLIQVIESTALIHLSQFGYTIWDHVRFDPVLNIRVGVAELVRLRRGYIEEGVETPGDAWTYTLHSYRWGPRNTRLLMNAKETRVEVPSLEYSVGVRELQLAYQDRGLG